LAGRITLRHSTGGVALPSVSVNVQDLPEYNRYCRYGRVSGGRAVQLCSGFGATEVYSWQDGTFATYVIETSSNGVYGSASAYHTWTEGPSGTFTALGADYTAELLHETEQGVYGGALSIVLEKGSGELNQYMCGPVYGRPYDVICITQVSHGSYAFGSGSTGGS